MNNYHVYATFTRAKPEGAHGLCIEDQEVNSLAEVQSLLDDAIKNITGKGAEFIEQFVFFKTGDSFTKSVLFSFTEKKITMKLSFVVTINDAGIALDGMLNQLNTTTANA